MLQSVSSALTTWTVDGDVASPGVVAEAGTDVVGVGCVEGVEVDRPVAGVGCEAAAGTVVAVGTLVQMAAGVGFAGSLPLTRPSTIAISRISRANRPVAAPAAHMSHFWFWSWRGCRLATGLGFTISAL